ncbi:MAG: integrase arm-type DNA-binding domain-containing protein [Desulfovibrio sp.]|nr:integrase arm-type DNA-binding domain-containing protein [Desulfovibrio sp.]MDR2819177.1 integrase arm-type DNA-binding domain-containing protein [Desulfovibrio sp.]
MKLTDTFVKRKQGNGKVQKHSDGGGLFLYITPTGNKSWRLAYRYMGKQKLLVIGPYPVIGLKEAREKRDAAKNMLVNNIDPSMAKQEAKLNAANAAKNSFEAVALEWHAKYSPAWVERYQISLLNSLRTHIFPYVGKFPIHTITAPVLLAALRRIEARGTVKEAHKLRSCCGRIFRYAIATGRAERDVAADLQGAIAPHVATHLASITEPREIGRLLLALDEKNGNFPISCGLRLAPMLFVRAGEMTRAEWSEIDFVAAEWRIPPGKMKMRQTHIVPLPSQAVNILKNLHVVTGRDRYLFPTQMRGKRRDGHINIGTLVAGLRQLGYSPENMTFHGFRSMASTLLNELGYNRDWIERQLAHSERDSVRAAYNYADYLPERRRMMQEYADFLDTLREKARE